MVNWTEIHPDFTPELQEEWERKGFDYEQTQKWINIGFTIQEANFCSWLINAKGINPLNFDDDIKKLWKEYVIYDKAERKGNKEKEINPESLQPTLQVEEDESPLARKEVEETIERAKEEIRKGIEFLEVVKPRKSQSQTEDLSDQKESEETNNLSSLGYDGDLLASVSTSPIPAWTQEPPQVHSQTVSKENSEIWTDRDETQSSYSATSTTSSNTSTFTPVQLPRDRNYNSQFLRMLHQIQADIAVKEELVAQLERSELEYTCMRAQYEERLNMLQEHLIEVQKQRDLALRRAGFTIRPESSIHLKEKHQVIEVKHLYEAKMKRLLAEIQDLRRKYTQTNASMQTARNQTESFLKGLRVSEEKLKLEKKGLLKQLAFKSQEIIKLTKKEEEIKEKLQAKNHQIKELNWQLNTEKKSQKEKDQQIRILQIENSELKNRSSRFQKQLVPIPNYSILSEISVTPSATTSEIKNSIIKREIKPSTLHTEKRIQQKREIKLLEIVEEKEKQRLSLQEENIKLHSLETEVERLTNLIKEQKEKIISAYGHFFSEKELLKELIATHLEHKKAPKEQKVKLRKHKERIYNELEEKISEEHLEEVEVILEDCEKLIQYETELQAEINKNQKFITNHPQTINHITYHIDNAYINNNESNSLPSLTNPERITMVNIKQGHALIDSKLGDNSNLSRNNNSQVGDISIESSQLGGSLVAGVGQIVDVDFNTNQTQNWTNIHPNFTPSLINQWKTNNFTHEQTQEWINIGLTPNDSNFCAWLRDTKHLTAEECLNYHDLNQLKSEYQAQLLQAQIQIPPKTN